MSKQDLTETIIQAITDEMDKLPLEENPESYQEAQLEFIHTTAGEEGKSSTYVRRFRLTFAQDVNSIWFCSKVHHTTTVR
uniref:Uncharacterized protein n=1 Tax=viral metagenome TaxID=1070528 RepID=A0A6M3L8N0_9ZZZZ